MLLLFDSEMTFRFFGIDVVDRNENSGLLHVAEIGIDHRAEHLHRGRQAHVGVDQRRYVFAVFPDLTGQDSVIFRIGASGEERLHLFGVEDKIDGMDVLDKVFPVGKVFVQEVEQYVPGLFVVGAVHGDFSEEVTHVRVVDDQCTQSVPEVVQRIESLGVAPRTLIVGLDERTSQFDGVGQIFVAESIRESEVVFGRHTFGMGGPRDDEPVPSDDFPFFGIPDEQLLVSFRIEILFVDVDVGSGSTASVAERELA